MEPLTAEERDLLTRLLLNLGLVEVRFDGRRVSATLPPVAR